LLARYYEFLLLDQKQGLHRRRSAADAHTLPVSHGMC
jgi:hypothetical protein